MDELTRPDAPEALAPREIGYYHVFDGEMWWIARWLPTVDAWPDEFGWKVPGTKATFRDLHWDEIDERRIIGRTALATVAATPAPARLDAEAMRGLVREWREDAKEDRAALRSSPSEHAYLYSAIALENCADALEAALPPQERADEGGGNGG